MTIRISEETIILVIVVIGIFLLALLCLACSLNPRELLDGSFFRCCCCCCWSRWCCRRSQDTEEPHVYETLNEFIFEADTATERVAGIVSLNNVPTTMEQVFPDLLGSEDPLWRGESENPSSANVDLSEPLL